MNNLFRVTAVSFLAIAVLAGCTTGKRDEQQPAVSNDESNGSQTAVSMPWVATKNTTRITTSDPADAAVLVSRTLWTAVTEQNRPASIILTDVENWQIAAASTDLIHHPSNGPLLYVTKDGIPNSTLDEIKRLKPMGAKENNGVQVVLVGSIAPSIVDQLKELNFKIDHIEGDVPAAIAQVIDDYYAKVAGKMPMSIVVGSMEQPEFTLPAVNWIAHMSEPLLYVTKDGIPEPTAKALQKRGGKANIYLLGPDSVISSKVEEELKAYGTVTRIAGKDAFENAVAFAKFKDAATQFGWGITTPGHNLSLVSKESTMLAIAAAPFAHLGKHAPLIITERDRIPDSVMKYVMGLQPKFQQSPAEGPYNHAWLTGDLNTLSEKIQSQIDDMLEISPASGSNPHAGH
ncbi:cell wall-binding repeat-containing protein [Paenibacillus turpanensis]|uniref:cell wall-binding repeat-containing protein n=1 Tax=Paenibacillus turpanensis TaxID=2689078 RepID=UPI0014094E59|nr:cell wall-binding repeat-containing protein [Paenibacillus turpanensis]